MKLYQILRIYNFSFLLLKHSMNRLPLVHYFMKEPLGVWAIVDKELEKMIGVVRFEKIDVQKRTAELLFLNASYWGRGLMTEAVTCLSNLALTAMGMDRIILIAHLENKASIRVAEKSGFKLVSRLRKADRYTRTMRDYLRWEGGELWVNIKKF